MLSRDEMLRLLEDWHEAWNAHDLDAVIELFHDEIEFENWNGQRVKGKGALRRAWAGWFEDHGDFRFTAEETFIDDSAQKALYRWQLEWPSRESKYKGQPEKRHGVDVLHFRDGKIVRKLTYSKTSLEIAGRITGLHPE